jgi:oligopeptide transport system ATP-binding protein
MLLSVNNLSVNLPYKDRSLPVLSDIAFSVQPGQTLGILGESGAGKTQLGLAMMGLSPKNAQITGEILFQGTPLPLRHDPQTVSPIRGNQMTMMFQDPLASLNPYLKMEEQLTEALIYHQKISQPAARAQILDLLKDLYVTDPEQRLNMYPFELSGGLRQRLMLAMAIATKPQILLADEPTTALDTTIQSQVLTLLKSYQYKYQMAIVLITHDLGVVASLCDNVIVMYGGYIVEHGPTKDLLGAPQHPYTQGLLKAAPRLLDKTSSLRSTIIGSPAHGLVQFETSGCKFSSRCPRRSAVCDQVAPPLQSMSSPEYRVACHNL